MRILASGGDYVLEGTVSDEADLDDRFILTEDDGTQLWVNGWLFLIEVIDQQGETHAT